ncbi:MAG: hypothetical protein RTU92_03460 [Candidatus Thorarchaeota archaeon]
MSKLFRALRFPTKQQDIIWLKRRQKTNPSTIAKKLRVSRPYISKAQRVAEQRIERLLQNTASVMRIDLSNLSGKFGFAVGYSSMHKSKTYITYSPSHGVQTWFDHVGPCETCEKIDECNSILDVLAEEWQILIPSGPPTERAAHLFSKIMERLNWS